MPTVGRFQTAAIADLCRQLTYASHAAHLRHITAAESLLRDIDPDQTYPADFVVFRLTGYRPETAEPTTILVGEALISDLAAFIQHVSRLLDLPHDHDGRNALRMNEVAQRLHVSAKTVQRYRRRGLVFHYVVFDDEIKRLGCFKDALDAFVQRNAARVRDAGAFTRLGASVEAELVAEARRLAATDDVSLNEVAKQLAPQFGRAHETVRLVLQRHDHRAETPIFSQRGPLSPRDMRLIDRALRFGVRQAVLARRFQRQPAAIQRLANRHRARFIRGLHLTWVELPTFALDDAETIILGTPACTSQLDELLPRLDVLALIDAAKARGEPAEDVELALVSGYNLLKRRARHMADAFSSWPGEATLDRVETDLRWAMGLKQQLADLALPTALRRIEQNLHGSLVQQPADELCRWVELAIQVSSDVIEGLDPARGHRLHRVTALSTDRALARVRIEDVTRRAAAKHAPGSVMLRSPYRQLTPWSERLALREDLLAWLGNLKPSARSLIECRYGLAGALPRTVVELAEQTGASVQGVRAALRQTIAELRRHARSAR